MSKNKNAEISTSEVLYTATMAYDAKTIRKLTETQYNTFNYGRKVLQTVASLVLIVFGVLFGRNALSIICLAVGCYLIVSLNYRPHSVADSIIKQYRDDFPNIHYFFLGSGIKTNQLPDITPYSEIIKLINDNTYLYIYFNKATAYMIDRSSLDSKGEFMSFVSEKTGLDWEKSFSLLKINFRDLINLTGFNSKCTDGDRLSDRHC